MRWAKVNCACKCTRLVSPAAWHDSSNVREVCWIVVWNLVGRTSSAQVWKRATKWSPCWANHASVSWSWDRHSAWLKVSWTSAPWMGKAEFDLGCCACWSACWPLTGKGGTAGKAPTSSRFPTAFSYFSTFSAKMASSGLPRPQRTALRLSKDQKCWARYLEETILKAYDSMQESCRSCCTRNANICAPQSLFNTSGLSSTELSLLIVRTADRRLARLSGVSWVGMGSLWGLGLIWKFSLRKKQSE